MSLTISQTALTSIVIDGKPQKSSLRRRRITMISIAIGGIQQWVVPFFLFLPPSYCSFGTNVSQLITVTV